MWSIFNLLTLLTVQGQNWLSAGDHTELSLIESRTVPISRESNLNPIRIELETNNLIGDLKDKVDNVKPNVINYLKNTLKVHRVQNSLTLGSFICAGNYYQDKFFIETDFYVIFELNTDTSPLDDVATGKSYTCHIEQSEKSNPLGGVIKLSNGFANLDKYRRWTYILHEIIHLLGFSEALSQKWFNELEGRSYYAEELTVTADVRGVTGKRFLKTPNVLGKARSAFNNPNLIGVELEEQGYFYDNINANEISHWDARIMHNDIMVIRSISEMIISTVTLAALEDSGWYKVEYANGQDPIVGRGKGCSFTDEPCITNLQSNNRNIWCSIGTTSACDTFNLNKGICILKTDCTLTNSAFNYFTDDVTGGRDVYEDFCPYIEALDSGSCRSNHDYSPSEIFSINSRCFEHTLSIDMSAPFSLSQSTACWEVNCDPVGSYIVKMKDSTDTNFIEFTCPQEGGLVRPGVYGSGWVRCPLKSTVCGDAPCIGVCYGNGICLNGYCDCFPGYAGPACEYICTVGCNVCSSNCCTQCATGFIEKNCGCTPCSQGCLDCSAEDDCTVCKDKYTRTFNSDTGKYYCEPNCTPGCPSCTVPDSCIIPSNMCIDNSGEMVSCCSNCAKCNPSKCCECLDCEDGYFLTSINTCTKSCAVNCIICANIYDCAVCKTGYLLNADNKCMKCPVGCKDCYDECPAVCDVNGETKTCDYADCFESCPTCSTIVCTICSAGYSFNANNECIKDCPENCKTCDVSTECTLCNSGFYINPVTLLCQACETGCIYCLPGSTPDYTICQTCNYGYYEGNMNLQHPDDVDCVRCQPGCFLCEKHETCMLCIDRYYLDTIYLTFNCIKCEYGCKICENSEICKTADRGFYILDNGHVNRCNKACATCDADQICNTCVAGYFFYDCTNTNCLCRYCEPNCARCSGPVECVVCRCGYYLAGVNECRLCESKCYSCDKPDTCNSCKAAYYLDADYHCQPCGPGCIHCSDADHCKCCSAGWWPDEFVCRRCPDKCSLCWTPSDCYACVSGWYLDQCLHSCETAVPTCKQCPDPCVSCYSEVNCRICKAGFYVLFGYCDACGPNCNSCLSPTHCNVCRGGFYVQADRTCAQCPEGCADCCDAWTCLRAKAGYFLESHNIPKDTLGAPESLIEVAAVKCSDYCIKCTALDNCQACLSSYYLDGGLCAKCDKGCTLCSSLDYCTKCATGYYLDDDKCPPCETNCLVCDTTGCTKAKSGFYIGFNLDANKNSPFLCQIPCSQCVGTAEYDCINCRAGYGTVTNPDLSLTTVKCDKCPQGCSLCTTSTFCTKALIGYFVWSDGSVNTCPENCYSCTADYTGDTSSPKSVCTLCKTSYGLKNGICEQCSYKCTKCADGDCTVCSGGYYVADSGFCNTCSSPCGNCLGSPTYCTSCVSRYYLSSPGTCSSCIPKCLTCTDENTCKKCEAKYYYVPANTGPSSCLPCVFGCNTCSDGVSCNTCISGYFLDIESSPQVCLNCRTIKGTNCKTCIKVVEGGVYSIKCLTCYNNKSTPDCL